MISGNILNTMSKEIFNNNLEVELADTIIRILDLAGFLQLDIGGAVAEKYQYNKTRLDHKVINRESSGGKTI